jgi:hypothetical protein
VVLLAKVLVELALGNPSIVIVISGIKAQLRKTTPVVGSKEVSADALKAIIFFRFLL